MALTWTPVTSTPRLCAALLALAALVGCSAEGPFGIRTEPVPSLAGLPGQGWQALPISRFVTRDSVRAEVIEICRIERCGFAAVVARVSVTGQEAETLAASTQRVSRLAALVREDADPRPVPKLAQAPGSQELGTRPQSTPKPVAARIIAQPLRVGAWSGASLALTGGAHGRSAYGAVLQRVKPGGQAENQERGQARGQGVVQAGVEAVIAVAERPDVALLVATKASEAGVAP